MTLPEAIQILERGLVVKEGTPAAKCQTGEPYVVYAANGIKPEGEAGYGYETEDLALRYWLKHVIEYKVKSTPIWQENKYTIYWRHPHKIECVVNPEDGKWHVYSRFVITDKEEINV